MEQVQNERGWRGSAELWLDAAYQMLVESGVDSVKVMPLAARLGLSRTSFYWHFPDREALLAGLVARWQSKNTDNLIARTKAPAASVAEAMLNVTDCWITPELFDSRMEFAIRTWALTDDALTKTLAEVDEVRIQALTAMFETFSYPKQEARIRAQTTYLTQVGYISMRTQEPVELRLQRIPDYVLIFTGQAPTEAELAAFRARHQVRSDAPEAP
jgi:AcrR family transcriptional regulator